MARPGPRPYAEVERLAVRSHWLSVLAVVGVVVTVLVCVAGHYPAAADKVLQAVPKAEARP